MDIFYSTNKGINVIVIMMKRFLLSCNLTFLELSLRSQISWSLTVNQHH